MIERTDDPRLVIDAKAVSAVYTRIQSQIPVYFMKKTATSTIVHSNLGDIYVIASAMPLYKLEEFTIRQSKPVYILINKEDREFMSKAQLTTGETRPLYMDAPDDRGLRNYVWLRVDLPSLHLCDNRNIKIDPWTSMCVLEKRGKIRILQPGGRWATFRTSSLDISPTHVDTSKQIIVSI